MGSFLENRALVQGILHCDNATKQKLGQRFARHLNLIPGPGGPDDGIDGHAIVNDRLIHFQCKLSSTPLDRGEAARYYSDIKRHGAVVSVMLAGAGYKPTFRERLFAHPDIGSVRIHLLTLYDLFDETEEYRAAVANMPRLSGMVDNLAEPPGDNPQPNDEMHP